MLPGECGDHPPEFNKLNEIEKFSVVLCNKAVLASEFSFMHHLSDMIGLIHTLSDGQEADICKYIVEKIKIYKNFFECDSGKLDPMHDTSYIVEEFLYVLDPHRPKDACGMIHDHDRGCTTKYKRPLSEQDKFELTNLISIGRWIEDNLQKVKCAAQKIVKQFEIFREMSKLCKPLIDRINKKVPRRARNLFLDAFIPGTFDPKIIEMHKKALQHWLSIDVGYKDYSRNPQFIKIMQEIGVDTGALKFLATQAVSKQLSGAESASELPIPITLKADCQELCEALQVSKID